MQTENYIAEFMYHDAWPNIMFVNNYPMLTILWNVFLMAVPFLLGLLLFKIYDGYKNKKKWYLIVASLMVFGLWLLFVPNTAYVITDARHLSTFCQASSIYRVCVEDAWYIPFFFTYALVGWIGYVLVVSQMKRFIDREFGRVWSTVFLMLLIPAIAIGVMLGLIDRWNSWEMFLQTENVIKNIWYYFTEPAYSINFVIYTALFYGLYYLGEILLNKNILNLLNGHEESKSVKKD